MRYRTFVPLATLWLCCLCAGSAAAVSAEDFAGWLDELRREARAAGISESTLDSALIGIEAPLPRVIERDRNQPEFTQTLAGYLEARVTPQRIAGGRDVLRSYPTWLTRVERRYRVQRRFLVALWGIESNYGARTGDLPVIHALVTLAQDERRGPYFRRELLEALQILERDRIRPAQLKGSWAGAMGPFQFMPSTYRRFAVDADGNGRRDIWNSTPDALASAANYLAKSGWRHDQTWGRPVRLPKGFDPGLAGLDRRQSLARWQALGVRSSDGRALPRRQLQASLLLPDGPDGPAFLVYDNFRALMTWNRSVSFAITVGTLADRLGETN